MFMQIFIVTPLHADTNKVDIIYKTTFRPRMHFEGIQIHRDLNV